MIEQINFDLTLSRSQYESLAAIRDWKGVYWKTPPNSDIDSIKDEIRRQLVLKQSKCAYCGITFKGRGDRQIEHIAAKSDARPVRHPEFTFTLKNLVLACPSCNGFSNKGAKETISVKHKLYSKCEFLIVHPYFDNPSDHFSWVVNRTEIIIKVKNDSSKGRASIAMFDLDSSGMTELRAGQYKLEQSKQRFPLSQRFLNLLNSTLNKI